MKAAVIVERLEVALGLDAPPRQLRATIENELTNHFGLPGIQAAERAERLEPRVAQLIVEKQLKCERDGTISVLGVVGSSTDMVLGSCYVTPLDSEAVAGAKIHRTQIEPLWTRIQNLTFDQFEKFGAKVLQELGAREFYVSRQSNDQGIDFYGTLNLGCLQNAPPPFFRLAHDLDVRFAGQAKHYPNKAVGTSALRELTGAVSLARFKSYSTDEDLFERLSLRPLSPLISLLFTTGRLTSGATKLAIRAGIVARSGMQLAVFLADRGVGMENNNGAKVFNPSAFDDWLNGI